MFKELAEIAKTTTLSLLIASVENELQVTVIPKPKEGMNPALCQPLVLTATPEELDEKFPSILAQYGNARKTLEETLADSKLYMEAAAKSAQESATAAAKTPAPAKKDAPAAPAANTASVDHATDEEPEEDDLFA